MTKIIFIQDENHIRFTQDSKPLDQILDQITMQAYPLPEDTQAEDWIDVNGVLIIALSRIPKRFESLSGRQIEILTLVLSGLTREEIAEQLEIMPTTVDFHLNTIKTIYQVRTRNELIAEFARDRERERLDRGTKLTVVDSAGN